MLERLLYEIRSGRALEVSALATRLGTSPALVQAMLEHLQLLGYLQPYGDACGVGCGGCSLSQACNLESRSRKINLWKYQE
jgi:hypothetical protein